MWHIPAWVFYGVGIPAVGVAGYYIYLFIKTKGK